MSSNNNLQFRHMNKLACLQDNSESGIDKQSPIVTSGQAMPIKPEYDGSHGNTAESYEFNWDIVLSKSTVNRHPYLDIVTQAKGFSDEVVRSTYNSFDMYIPKKNLLFTKIYGSTTMTTIPIPDGENETCMDVQSVNWKFETNGISGIVEAGPLLDNRLTKQVEIDVEYNSVSQSEERFNTGTEKTGTNMIKGDTQVILTDIQAKESNSSIQQDQETIDYDIAISQEEKISKVRNNHTNRNHSNTDKVLDVQKSKLEDRDRTDKLSRRRRRKIRNRKRTKRGYHKHNDKETRLRHINKFASQQTVYSEEIPINQGVLENRKPEQNENRTFPVTSSFSKGARRKSSYFGHRKRLKPKQKNACQRKSIFSVRTLFVFLLLLNGTNAEDMKKKGDFVKNVNGNMTTLRCYTSDLSLLNGDKSWGSWTCGNESIHQYPLSIGNTPYDICLAPECRINCSERFCDLLLYKTSYVTCYCSSSESKNIKEMESVTFDPKLGRWSDWSTWYETSDGNSVQNTTRSCESQPYSSKNCSEVKCAEYRNVTSTGSNNNTNITLIVGVPVPLILLFVIIVIVVIIVKRRKNRNRRHANSRNDPNESGMSLMGIEVENKSRSSQKNGTETKESVRQPKVKPAKNESVVQNGGGQEPTRGK